MESLYSRTDQPVRCSGQADAAICMNQLIETSTPSGQKLAS